MGRLAIVGKSPPPLKRLLSHRFPAQNQAALTVHSQRTLHATANSACSSRTTGNTVARTPDSRQLCVARWSLPVYPERPRGDVERL